MGRPNLRCRLAVVLIASAATSCPRAQASKEDSGWVPLFNGKDFNNGFYVYSSGYAPIAGQTHFAVDSGMIHAGGPYALLLTTKEYAYYKIRVDYRFGPKVGGNGNAGMMILMDNQAAQTATSLRPRSIEINCRRDTGYPWTLWASSGLGPIMDATVQSGTAKFIGKAEGGMPYVVDPSGNRTLESAYPNPELPPPQWNHGEAYVYGDSGVFYLNGKLRTASWHWRVTQAGKSVRTARGGVGVQSEGFDIWYKDWEIQELDSASLIPINARRGCTDPKSSHYDPHAVIADGSCVSSSIALRARASVQSPEAFPPQAVPYTADGKRLSASSARAIRRSDPVFFPLHASGTPQ